MTTTSASRPAAAGGAPTGTAVAARSARRDRAGRWFRGRPAIGGLLAVLGGLELFFSGQLDIGRIHISIGIEGLQATVIPFAIVLLGLLATLMPQHRIFYGVILLALALYSLVGVNLGGFLVGMLLSAVGGVLIVAWMPRGEASRASASDTGQSGAAVSDAETEASVGSAASVSDPPRAGATAGGTAGRSLPEYVAPVSTAAYAAELVAARSGSADAAPRTVGS